MNFLRRFVAHSKRQLTLTVERLSKPRERNSRKSQLSYEAREVFAASSGQRLCAYSRRWPAVNVTPGGEYGKGIYD